VPEGRSGSPKKVRRTGKSEAKSEKGGAARRKVKKVWDGRRSPKKARRIGEGKENREGFYIRKED
jgi:hypothetical protein